MLPNHYEVEEVSRIRREEATQHAARDRLRHDANEANQQGRHSARRAGSASMIGELRQRLTMLFKRGERRSARVTANQLPITNDFR